jgi:hypothetical protein
MVPSSTVHAAAAAGAGRSKGKINYCEMMLVVVLATSWAACVSMLLPHCRCCDVVRARTRMVIDPRAHTTTQLPLPASYHSFPPPPRVDFNGMHCVLCVELLIDLTRVFLLKCCAPCVGKATATVATSSSLSIVSLSHRGARRMGGAKHEREIYCSTKVRCNKTVVNYSMHEALGK